MVRLEVSRIQDHAAPAFEIDSGVGLALDVRGRGARRRGGPRVAVSRLRAAVFDFGETLLSEERAWGVWADWIGATRQELFAAIGRATSRGPPPPTGMRSSSVRRGFDLRPRVRGA